MTDPASGSMAQVVQNKEDREVQATAMLPVMPLVSRYLVQLNLSDLTVKFPGVLPWRSEEVTGPPEVTIVIGAPLALAMIEAMGERDTGIMVVEEEGGEAMGVLAMDGMIGVDVGTCNGVVGPGLGPPSMNEKWKSLGRRKIRSRLGLTLKSMMIFPWK